MSTQSKPTKRQMRNLKVVRWPSGQLYVANTKTQRFHCYAIPFDKEEEERMINAVAIGDGPAAGRGQIDRAWNGCAPYMYSTQIRL